MRLATGIALPPRESCSTGTLVEGSLRLLAEETRIDLRCGDSFVIPAEAGSRLEGGPATVIMTFIE